MRTRKGVTGFQMLVSIMVFLAVVFLLDAAGPVFLARRISGEENGVKYECYFPIGHFPFGHRTGSGTVCLTKPDGTSIEIFNKDCDPVIGSNPQDFCEVKGHGMVVRFCAQNATIKHPEGWVEIVSDNRRILLPDERETNREKVHKEARDLFIHWRDRALQSKKEGE